MNKAQLIDALAERLGDRKAAAAAVAGLADVIVRTVSAGERVTITGFGVFEKRARAARTARNPRTGQTVTVQQTTVPAFRPGTLFREVVSGTRTLPESDDGATAMAQPAARQTPANPPGANPGPSALQVTPATAAKASKSGKAGKAAKAAKPKSGAKGLSKTAKKTNKKAADKK